MRNGVRHLLGAGAGLLATPFIAVGLGYGFSERYRMLAQVTIDWIAMGAFAGALVVIGVLAGSRLSPLASLLPGLAFTGFALTGMVRLGMGGDHRLWYDLVPSEYLVSYATLLHSWSLPAGCLLLAASVFPSRWRGKVVREEPPPPSPEEEAPEPPPLPRRIPSRY
ncbi:hypothetical protein [Nonomuraea basaltis]|uniref:hypothetical protein n=1 Tax=Nonomuraea basaltis TaxID=2495887 RepID=UPI00110C66D0|nr:hypothetical protein [Nonomuraea basaltis]TMR89783.1 hypothetical protein EJK15_58890 [Nonomuraea basaltis]